MFGETSLPTILISLSIVVVFSISFFQCKAFGKDPEGSHKELIQKSTHYDHSREQFVNRRPDVLEKMREGQNFFSLFVKFMFGGDKYQKPSVKLPEEKPNFQEFLKPDESIKFIWFGHSTFLVNIEGTILLFDPVFSGSAAPFAFMVKRFQDAVVKLEELPKIDYIIISHDHYDHLDMETIDFFKAKDTRFLTPLGVTSHLKEWGIPEDRLTELDWWEKFTIGKIQIVCTPAQHFSGRRGMNGNQTLWSSWTVIGEKERFYFSGDSGYDIHFKQIGDTYGPFDLTFIENGQYNPMWEAVHVLPEQTAKAHLDLKGKRLVPVHWGMFNLSLHSWYEPAENIERESKKYNIDLMTPKFGQLVKLKEPNLLERWWKKYIETD
ncbi:MBL fold metallo-hydrolase [Leptospira levettii]|uniref:MBL fold metallo-hydrolase n=1 Tax=Leptospira levettii TaxID=2023178 RepID=A0ABY2MN77_9LEPT|nr:MBL fold metallo-hydrolase [Leptospira levettii]TGL12062.1 MBL fold metallo-hydrolase [Leptospira levettii]TGL70173.1 MBL fold metallo-hydrolase [Leptospira levettii]TGM28773.1 MBL fold metallo-hydrolase [Leptospira levettii]TGM32596.1 MBL fold metallo-hydrolase [Leptospira levettii]